MKKITLLLSLLFCIIGIGETFAATPITAIDGTTKITAASALDKTKVYMIMSSDGTNARGVLCCTADGNNLTRCAADGQTTNYDKTDPYQQFVFLPYLGKYYLYNVGKKKFCKDVGDTAEMTEAVGQAQHVTVTAGSVSGTFMIKFNGTDQIGLSNANSTGVYPSTSAGDDAGTRLYIAAVNGVTFSTEAYNEAMGKLLNMLSATLYPQNGKAYRIKARYYCANSSTIEYRYLYEGNDRISLSSSMRSDNTDIFICRVNPDGTYSFVTNKGKWLVYYAENKNGAGGTTNGLAANYELGTYDATWALSESTSPSTSGSTNKQLDLNGTIRMQGRNTTDNGNYYLMAGATAENSSDGNFHNGDPNVTYFTNTRSSFFIFEEVTYPNTPTMTACNNIESGKKIATFSAKFPTLVPEGLSAYIISSNSAQSAHMEAIASAGQVIPANTGVLLFGATDETNVTMVPATTEGTGVTFSSTNKLAHSAGAAITIGTHDNAYILANDAKHGIAFYSCVSGTLAMNKAYLSIGGGSTNGKAFTLTLGGESTDIHSLENSTWNTNTPIYDLSGRRVQTPIKGNLYIQNGHKFIKQ